MYRYYLLHNAYLPCDHTGFGEGGHFLIYNIGRQDIQSNLTCYFQDKEPFVTRVAAVVGTTSCYGFEHFGDELKGRRFAIVAESSYPMICHATEGMNSDLYTYPKKPGQNEDVRIREASNGYTAITAPAKTWRHADGIVVDNPEETWIKEQEWLIVLNDTAIDLELTLTINYPDGTIGKFYYNAAPMRFIQIAMDDIVRKNIRYHLLATGNQAFTAQWLKQKYWYHTPEIMTSWSIPLVSDL